MTLSPTPRSTIRRGPHRAVSERSELYAVLDQALVCHLAVVVDDAPIVLPTGFARDNDTLYVHGSTGAKSLRVAAAGTPICIAVTLLDGIVYSRAVFDFSMNYRCAVIHGQAVAVTDRGTKLHALHLITEHLAPGSWDYARRPTEKELAATSVLAIDLTEASVKIRTGDPADDPEDIAASSVWAGELPIRQVWGTPRASADLPPEIAPPPHVIDRPVWP